MHLLAELIVDSLFLEGNTLFDRVLDGDRLRIAVRLHNKTGKSEERCSAIGRSGKLLKRLSKDRFQQKAAKLSSRGGINGFLHLLLEHVRRALVHLQNRIAGKGIGDNHIG